MKTKNRMSVIDAIKRLTDEGFNCSISPFGQHKLQAREYDWSEIVHDVALIDNHTVDSRDVDNFIELHRYPFRYYLGTFGFDVNAITYLIDERGFEDVTHQKSSRPTLQKVIDGHEIIVFFDRDSKVIELKVIEPCGKLAIKAESESLERLLAFAVATTKLTV